MLYRLTIRVTISNKLAESDSEGYLVSAKSASSKPKEPISAKEAAERAADHLRHLFGAVTDLQIEEVTLTDDDRYWWITLSYLGGGRPFGFRHTQYKQFKVDARTGKVRSMIIRQV